MSPDPQEAKVLQAGEEAPRCQRCDRPIPDWPRGTPLDCGCPESPVIIPSSLSAQECIVLLSGPEAKRGNLLARALGGRFIRSFNGYALTPAKADRWQLLFDHGLSAARGYRYGPGWWFLAPDGQRFNPYTVMEYIKTRIIK